MQRLTTALVVLAVVLAGCNAPVNPGTTNATTASETTTDVTETTTDVTETTTDATDATDDPPADPETDVIGWEDGIWYNESIDVDQSDGLTDEEIAAYVARAMARVEHIRGKEFQERVPVEVMTRSEYADSSVGSGTTKAQSKWNNQVWESLLISSEEENVSDQLSQFFSTGVAGFYSPDEDAIVVITDSPDNPVIDNATLVHELEHALQDQHFNLSKETYSGETQDGDLAIDGIVEGDANYVESVYKDYCGNGTWSCVNTPASDQGGGQFNFGIYVTVFNPYSDGPHYVHQLKQAGGWALVDEVMDSPPETTETVIHARLPNESEEPIPIDYENTAQGDWERFEDQGVDGYDTVGEASIYAMFWYASYPEQGGGLGLDIIDWRSLLNTDQPRDLYDYRSEPSAGWGNDHVYPYTSPNSDEDGYVWVTEWDTERDAEEFHDAYIQILQGLDAERVDETTWRISEGEYADTFRVVIDGSRVVIVNGPDAAAVNDLKPEYAPETNATSSTSTVGLA